MRKNVGDKTVNISMIPCHIFQLWSMPSLILSQCNCPLGHAMSAFSQFALGRITLRPFTDRAVGVLIHLGGSLEAILVGLENTSCDACLRMKHNLDVKSRKALSNNTRHMCQETASDFTTWLCNHMIQDFESSNRYLASSQGIAVSIDTKGGAIYEYVDVPWYEGFLP